MPLIFFSLKKVIFLPLTFPGVNDVLKINNGLPIFVAGNIGNTLVQVLPHLKDGKQVATRSARSQGTVMDFRAKIGQKSYGN